MLLTNVVGTFAVTKAFLPLLKQGKKKVIVNMSSDAGCLTQNASFIHDNQPSDAGMALSYRTSKTAVNMGRPTGSFFKTALLKPQPSLSPRRDPSNLLYSAHLSNNAWVCAFLEIIMCANRSSATSASLPCMSSVLSTKHHFRVAYAVWTR